MGKSSDTQYILVVDDNSDSLHILGEALKKEGYTIVPTLSSNVALEITKKRKIKPALVILDIKMPPTDMDGLQLCEEIRLIPDMQDVPILFISVANNPKIIEHAIAIGGNDFIPKPYVMDSVLDRVEYYLKSNSYRKKN